MNFFSKGDAPNHRINALVGIVFGHLGLIEVQLKDYVVHLQHSLQTCHQNVAFLDVYRFSILQNLEIEALREHSGQDSRSHSIALLQSINDEPKMYLYHLRLYHIIMRNVQRSRKLKRLDVINDPYKYLFMNPLIILTLLSIIKWLYEPVELQIIEVRPILIQFFKFQSVLKSGSNLKRVEICPVVNV